MLRRTGSKRHQFHTCSANLSQIGHLKNNQLRTLNIRSANEVCPQSSSNLEMRKLDVSGRSFVLELENFKKAFMRGTMLVNSNIIWKFLAKSTKLHPNQFYESMNSTLSLNSIQLRRTLQFNAKCRRRPSLE